MTTATKINKTQWSNLFKFANKKDDRKSISGIHFTNEYAVATDSHRVVFLFDNFTDRAGTTLDKEQNVILCDYKFPDMSRFLINDFNDTNNQFKVNVNELLQMHKDILLDAKNDVRKNNQMFMNISIDEKVFFYANENTTKFEPVVGFRTWKYDECKKAYNCKFMIDVLSLFKSFKQTEIIIKFKEKMQPISLESLDGKIKVLMMPIRVS